MLSGPVLGVFGDSHVAFRLAADWATSESASDGYVPYPTVDDVGQFQALNLRGKLLFEPPSIPGWRTPPPLNPSDSPGPQTDSVVRATAGLGKRQNSPATKPVPDPKPR